MHVRFGPYHVRDVKFVAAFDVDAKKVGFDLSEAIFASENNTIKIADVPPTNVTVQRGPTLDGIGKYYAETIEVSDADPVDVVKVLKDNNVDVLVSYLPVGSEEADKFYAQCAHRRRRGVRQRAAGVHRLRPGVGQEVRRRRRADRRRRHQEPGRRDHHPPRDGQAVRGSRRAARPHDAAQRRRQHGLPQHARARAPGVEEDLQDAGRHVEPAARVQDQGRAHRPVRSRRLARRPQVGLRPPRGPRVRRRAAEPGVQARGVGLAELRRRHHRRGARGEDRQGPRHRRARSSPRRPT